jgi:hypothetical protein
VFLLGPVFSSPPLLCCTPFHKQGNADDSLHLLLSPTSQGECRDPRKPNTKRKKEAMELSPFLSRLLPSSCWPGLRFPWSHCLLPLRTWACWMVVIFLKAPCAFNKDGWLDPLAAFHTTSFAKSREKSWAPHRNPYQCGDGQGRLTRQNKGRQPWRQVFHHKRAAFDFAACTMSLTMPANRPSKGVGEVGVGERKAKASFKLLTLACHPLSVCGRCVSVLIIHFPEVSRCEGTRHASSWFP